MKVHWGLFGNRQPSPSDITLQRWVMLLRYQAWAVCANLGGFRKVKADNVLRSSSAVKLLLFPEYVYKNLEF